MSEFSNTSVPPAQRQATSKVLLVSLGLTAVAINMMVGGILGASMPPSGWFSVILVGGVFLSIVAGYTAYYSHRTGMTFALQAALIFGESGSRYVAGFVGIIILGWYSIQASLLGHSISQFFGLSNNVEYLLLFCIPIVLATTAMKGFRWLVYLSAVAVPAIFLLSLLALIQPGDKQPVVEVSTISWTTALTMVISLWIMGAVATIGDIARYAATSKAAVSSAVLAFIFGNTGLMLAGAWASNAFGIADLSAVLNASGFAAFGLLLLIFNIWSTNDNAIYSVGLNWAHASRTDYRRAVQVAALLAAFGALFKPYESQVLSAWLTNLGLIVPALGGVILGRRVGGVRVHPLTTWASLILGVFTSVLNPLSLGPIFGVIVGFIAQFTFERTFPRFKVAE